MNAEINFASMCGGPEEEEENNPNPSTAIRSGDDKRKTILKMVEEEYEALKKKKELGLSDGDDPSAAKIDEDIEVLEEIKYILTFEKTPYLK